HPPVAQEAHREVGRLCPAPVRAPVWKRPPRAHQRTRGRAVPIHPAAPGLRAARAAQERHEGHHGVPPGHPLQRPRHRGDHRQQRHRPRHPDLGPWGGDPARAAGQGDPVPLQHGREQRPGPPPGGALPPAHGPQQQPHARVRVRAAHVPGVRRVPGGVPGAAVAAGGGHRRVPAAAAHRRQGRELPHLGLDPQHPQTPSGNAELNAGLQNPGPGSLGIAEHRPVHLGQRGDQDGPGEHPRV
ncbi:branched chain ketoacid dehydrogenase kinase, partial [Columba livia]